MDDMYVVVLWPIWRLTDADMPETSEEQLKPFVMDAPVDDLVMPCLSLEEANDMQAAITYDTDDYKACVFKLVEVTQ